MMSRKKTQSTQAEAAERYALAAKLKAEGYSLQEIADRMGLKKTTANYYVYGPHAKTGGKTERTQHVSSNGATSGHDNHALEVQQAYPLGSVEYLVRHAAASHNLPFGTLAEGLAAGLRALARR
jgi:hypothetical protein